MKDVYGDVIIDPLDYIDFYDKNFERKKYILTIDKMKQTGPYEASCRIIDAREEEVTNSVLQQPGVFKIQIVTGPHKYQTVYVGCSGQNVWTGCAYKIVKQCLDCCHPAEKHIGFEKLLADLKGKGIIKLHKFRILFSPLTVLNGHVIEEKDRLPHLEVIRNYYISKEQPPYNSRWIK